MASLKPVAITKHPDDTASFLFRMNDGHAYVERATENPKPIKEVVKAMRDCADWVEQHWLKKEVPVYDPTFCAHANEAPNVCPCSSECSCKETVCSSHPKG